MKCRFFVILMGMFLFSCSHAVTNSVIIDGDVDAVGDWDDENCLPDVDGQNDVPGQKDVNYACIASNFATVQPSDTIYLRFDFDVTGLNGGNSGDGCWLLDQDQNGGADLAVCFTLRNNPFTLVSADVKGYTCNGANLDRCSGHNEIVPFSVNCQLDGVTANFFDNSDDDASVECSIPITTFGLSAGDIVSFLFGCSYPSAVPNSAPSDCVNDINNPFVIDTNTGDSSTPVELIYFNIE